MCKIGPFCIRLNGRISLFNYNQCQRDIHHGDFLTLITIKWYVFYIFLQFYMNSVLFRRVTGCSLCLKKNFILLETLNIDILIQFIYSVIRKQKPITIKLLEFFPFLNLYSLKWGKKKVTKLWLCPFYLKLHRQQIGYRIYMSFGKSITYIPAVKN